MRGDASGGVNDDLPMVSQLAFKEGPVPSFLVPPRLVFPYPQVFVLTASTPYTKRGGGEGGGSNILSLTHHSVTIVTAEPQRSGFEKRVQCIYVYPNVSP